MMFVDGENLTIRYGNILKSKGLQQENHVFYEPDVYVWSYVLRSICIEDAVLRTHYYTSALRDEAYRREIEDTLKSRGIESPHVFKRTKSRGSKRVDISLSTAMLLNACRKNYDVVILIAGDEDYLPLVEAVKAEGRIVLLWFFEDGLSPVLKRSADHYADIGKILLRSEAEASSG
jgi:uncharacterized LabA/DUF88 family protein